MATRNSEAGGSTGGSGGTGAGQKSAGGASAGSKGGASGAGSKTGGGKSATKTGGGRTGAKKPTGTRAGASKAADTSTGATKATGTRGGTKKAAGSRGGAKAGTAAKKSGTGGGNQKLRSDLRGFVQAHPGGWGHNEWIGLVNLLKEQGHDTSDTDAIGMALERERLTLVLERVPGLGAQRVKAIADKYPRIWNVMQAGAEELAMAANLPKALAKKVKDALP